jgi:hypothetical protein
LRILVTSDFHGRKEAFQKLSEEIRRLEVDVTVICGDITNFGSAELAKSLLSCITRNNSQVFYVPGNCDLHSLLEAKIEGAQNIHGGCSKIRDLSFVGVGGSPISPLNTPIEFSENEISDFLINGFSKCSGTERIILVSHAPPFNTKLDLAFNGKHIGSLSVRGFVEEKKPLAVFCGHVHEARGIDRIDGTIILNPGSARRGYYAVADVNGAVEARLETFKQF